MRLRSDRMTLVILCAFLVGGCAVAVPGESGVAGVPGPSSPSAPTQSASGTAPPQTGGSGAGSKRRDARFDQALAELVAMPGGPPGAVAVVQVGSRRTFHSAGVADVATGVRPTIKDHMRIASVAKAFSGAAALALVDKGLLSLDDTVARRLPALPAGWGEVTLRQLLNHTSGIPDLTRSPEFVDAVVASPDKAPPPEQLLQFLAEQPLDFPPGTRYAYSNSDNIAVALMIQAVTGRSYSDVLADTVIRPLKLRQTSLPEGIQMPRPTLRGYDLSKTGTPEDDTDALAAGWAWASGGVVSTPADLNTFIRAYVRGDLYRARTRAQQQRLFIPSADSSPPGPGVNSASLALFRYQTSCGTVYGHTGNTFGYTQFAAASPDGRRSVIVAMTLQRTETSSGQELAVFHALQQVKEAGVCLALQKR
jgi:D-alanyl-D-alanine carboxypeptidase